VSRPADAKSIGMPSRQAYLTHVGGAASSSQRDSDRVFENKLLCLRRLHFAKAVRGPTRAVSKCFP